jgi:hypothetical protein
MLIPDCLGQIISELARGFTVKIGKLADSPGVSFLGAIAQTGKLQSPHGCFVIVLHHTSPFILWVMVKKLGRI